MHRALLFFIACRVLSTMHTYSDHRHCLLEGLLWLGSSFLRRCRAGSSTCQHRPQGLSLQMDPSSQPHSCLSKHRRWHIRQVQDSCGLTSLCPKGPGSPVIIPQNTFQSLAKMENLPILTFLIHLMGYISIYFNLLHFFSAMFYTKGQQISAHGPNVAHSLFCFLFYFYF